MGWTYRVRLEHTARGAATEVEVEAAKRDEAMAQAEVTAPGFTAVSAKRITK
jgi:hypothetical protein